jgi:hypothetical protein
MPSGDQPSPAALARARTKFGDDVRKLLSAVISNTYLNNCQPAADLLVRNSKLIVGGALYAFDRSNNIPLRSLSYIFENGSLKGLGPTPITLSEFSANLGGKDDPKQVRRIVFEGNNSHCIFLLRECDLNAELLDEVRFFGVLYNYMVFSSHNYRNYVGARIRYQAKPTGGDDYYPHFENIEQICEQLSTLYNVRARHFVYVGNRQPKKLKVDQDFSTYDRKTVAQFCRKKSLDADFANDLCSVIVIRQSRIGLLAGRKKQFYSIFPVYDPNLRGTDVPPDGVVIILSPSPLGLFVMRAAEEWLNAFSSKRHVRKASVISDCLKVANDEIQKIGVDAGLYERIGAFERVARELCVALCACTHAASVSVRRIDRRRGILKKIAEYQSNWGAYHDKILKQKKDKDISMKLIATSFNAFSVAYTGSEKVLNIENISVIPRRFKHCGLRQILQHHKFTRTEAIARVLAGKSCIALINIEAPVPGSLRQYESFFEKSADFLGEVYQHLFSLTDASGLAAMAKIQVELHAVADLLREWRDGDGDGAQMIVRRLRQLRIRPIDQAEADVREIAFPQGTQIGKDSRLFNASLTSWVEFMINAMGFSELKPASLIEGGAPRLFDPNLIPSLFVVTMSIMENILSRPALLPKNRVKFSDELVGFPTKRRLTIEWQCDHMMDPSVDRNGILLKPWIDTSGQSHFGFFLIGIHARQHGGTAEFFDTYDEDKQTIGFGLKVSLPYEPRFCRSKAGTVP